jgi:hypothetical protein
MLGAIVGLAVITVAYKYLSSDEYERACGVVNLFRTDYSDEISSSIRAKVEDADTSIDFTALDRWETICLTSVYNEETEFYFIPDMDRPMHSTWAGKSQCRGNVPGTVTLLLITRDGAALTRKLSLPAGVNKAQFYTSYEVLRLPTGFRQCATTRNARARCGWISARGERRCLLLFPSG